MSKLECFFRHSCLFLIGQLLLDKKAPNKMGTLSYYMGSIQEVPSATEKKDGCCGGLIIWCGMVRG